MLKQFLMKLKESVIAVLPIVLLILIVGVTPIPLYNLNKGEIIGFSFGSIMVIIGIALFNLGADMAMTPMGNEIGRGLTKKKKLGLLLIVSLLIGILVTVSEPDLSVLANQLSSLLPSEILLIVVVGLGVGAFLVVAILKIVFRKSLSMLLMFFYFFLFALAVVACIGGGKAFLPLSFDSGGVTTGPITVPFIMALGIGIAKTLNSKDAKENSFGLIALCSVGAVVAVLLLSIVAFKGDAPIYDTSQYDQDWTKILGTYFKELFTNYFGEVGLSLGLIVAVFLVCQFTFIKLDKNELGKIGIGILLTFLGLTLFLTAANTTYLSIGYHVGQGLSDAKSIYAILFALIIGALVVLAEPAIQVLVNQVEEVTDGTVSKKSMLLALAIGVGLALAISVTRVIFDFDLMYIIVPGYILSLALSLFVPPIYTAIAFDSGGVASGPLTSCFILPLMVGLCASQPDGINKIFEQAFGVVALVAMVPLITIQLLGFNAIIKKKRERRMAVKAISSDSDEQIIEF